MKLFSKKLEQIPNQRKIEELEIELGITPVVTEENFEREFDRALINDYREKYGIDWIKFRKNCERYGSYRMDSKKYREDSKREDNARRAYVEVEGLLMLKNSKKAFEEEFSPYHRDNMGY